MIQRREREREKKRERESMAAPKTVNVLLEIKQGRDLAAKDRGGMCELA